MAGYKEHISVSGMLGVAYGVIASQLLGFTATQGALAGCLTWVSGMLPDLDSNSGRPIRELFNLLAALAPCVMMRRLVEWGGDPETGLLMAIGLFAMIRYCGPAVLSKFSVHRGMYHSIPAMLIAAELVFLAYHSESMQVKMLMAGAVCVGFLSHLVLDEMYSVQWSGVRITLNSAAGSALKCFGKKAWPNLLTYSLLCSLTYATLVTLQLVEPPEQAAEAFRHAAVEKADEVRQR